MVKLTSVFVVSESDGVIPFEDPKARKFNEARNAAMVILEKAFSEAEKKFATVGIDRSEAHEEMMRALKDYISGL